MKYVRTINNYIYKVHPDLFIVDEIIKTGETIEDLIMMNDLVKEMDEDGYSWLDEVNPCYFENGKLCKGEKELITELYLKQGNDYILVARKEDGKGELKLV